MQPAAVQVLELDGSLRTVRVDDCSLATSGGGLYVWKDSDSGARQRYYIPMHRIWQIMFDGVRANAQADAWREVTVEEDIG